MEEIRINEPERWRKFVSFCIGYRIGEQAKKFGIPLEKLMK